MCRGDLDYAGALFHIGVLVADDRDLLVHQRQDHMTAVQVLVALVVLVDGDGGIAEHGLGTGGRDLQQLAGLLDRIEDVPEMTLLFFVFYLRVGDGGVAVRTPVDQAVAAVDLAVVIQLDEYLSDRV